MQHLRGDSAAWQQNRAAGPSSPVAWPFRAGEVVKSHVQHHFVWGTKYRQPLILDEFEARLHDKIRRKARELGIHLYAVNGMEDHVHVVSDLPPRLSVEEVLNGLKGSSSHFINHIDNGIFTLYWQKGYSAHTFSKSALASVVSYVNNQKAHHAEGRLKPELEFLTDFERA